MSKGPHNQTLRLGVAAVLFGALQLAVVSRSPAATLPVAMDTWVTSGAASLSQSGNALTVSQTTSRAILNWSSFNIGADGQVRFIQPDGNSVALNRIFDANPSQIFGSLEANGQLYLLNQNGFLFGAGARVNTGGLLASSLNLSDDTFANGLLSAATPARLAPALEAAGNLATIVVAPGAQLTTNAAGQRILLSAKTIDNRGTVTANDGQVVLAAGEKVYLLASDNPALRGLLVEVDGGGTVNNTGTVTAERGNITAVGLAINQDGRISATTSVSANGSIRLLARDSTRLDTDGVSVTLHPERGGALRLGAGSVSEVNPDVTDTSTAIDEQVQTASSIEMSGKTIAFGSGSTVRAAGGSLTAVAASNTDIPTDLSIADPDARILVDTGAVIDVSGSTAAAPIERNLVTVELRSNELAGSPLQRNGALRGTSVVVDSRVTTESGNRGTDIGDVSGAVALIQRGIAERTSAGGTARLESAGSVVVAEGATVDVSGGAVTYSGGVMRTTQLIRADGSVVDIGSASPNDTYLGLINPTYKAVSDRWGVVQFIDAPGIFTYEPGYVEGSDAGTLQVIGNTLTLAGNFLGSATNGSYQRTTDQIARGGQIAVSAAASIALQGFRATEVGIASLGTSASAATANGPTVALSSEALVRGGFSRIQLTSYSDIAVSAEPIELTSGGSLSLAAPRVELLGDVSVAAGTITVAASNPLGLPISGAPGIFVANNVDLDVRGLWVNDANVPPDQIPTGFLLTNAGSIAFTQEVNGGTLALGDNVTLRSSGGAWITQSGSVRGGKGGNVSVLASAAGSGLGQLRFGENLAIEGFGVQGAAGGSISIRAPRVEIVSGDQALAAQEVNGSAAMGSTLRIGNSLFSRYGFANFTVWADSYPLQSDINAAALRVAAGTPISLAPQTLALGEGAITRDSARSVEGFTTAVDVLEHQARAGSLTLRAQSTLPSPSLYGALRIEQGATITGNAGTRVTLTSSGNLSFDGSIRVAGGDVGMTILKEDVDLDRGFLDRRLTVGAAARVDVSGATIRVPNDLGLELGSVLDGGTVTLLANRGSIDIKAGSMLDVSGTQGEFDWQDPLSGEYQHGQIASVGGRMSIRAEESIAMLGDLRASGGLANDVHNTGGTLSVSVIRNIQRFPGTYPNGPRVVQIVNEASASPANGIASVDADILAASGIGSLELRADDQIAIGSGVNLELDGSLILDAAAVSVLGSGAGTLGAGYIAIGPQQDISRLPQASSGNGLLVVQADQLDLLGTVALQNISQATFSSNGDIGLKGYGASTIAPAGRLMTLGDVTLRAERVFPTTGSRYTIDATGGNSTVTFRQVGSSPGIPLSAAGTLIVNAPKIVQGGTVMAPFGTIEMNAANSLQFISGSYTSVSGNGATLPYGRVDNGATWVWGRDPTNPATITSIPDRRISLRGAAVDLMAGATIDLAGGGDLLAYQFTPGTNGKQDVLDPAAAGYLDDTFVVIPALAGQSVPYDPMMWRGSTISPGQSIHLAAGSGVTEGVYQLLPTRYALTPGAFMVTAVAGYEALAAGSTAVTPDGGTVVAGYLTFGDAANAAARSSGFVVRPGSYARTLAQYDDRYASEFFAAQAAVSGGAARLPSDAGTLVVAVNQALSALSTVRGDAAIGGRRATVELSASAIEVVGPGAGGSGAGTVRIQSSSLSSWNAGRLLIGGSSNANGAITPTSSSVTIRSGANVLADEVVLVASQGIVVDSGAVVQSRSGGAAGIAPLTSIFDSTSFLDLTGGNAATAGVLAVSDLGYLVTRRGVAQGANGATVTIASGARVATQGAVAVDGSGLVSIANGSVVAQGASWFLGANHVAFGDASLATDGLAIDSTLQSELQSARSLRINSAGSLDFGRAVTLGNDATRVIGLTAATISNQGGAVGSTVSADLIALNGINSVVSALTPGSGSIAFNADRIELGGGELGLSGFASTTLNSTGVIVGTATGGVTSTGSVDAVSSAVTATSGARTSIRAEQGIVRFTQAASAAPALNTLETGGTLMISGLDIIQGGHILMPSGVVELQAIGSLRATSGSVIDTSGYQPPLASTGSSGGSIRLGSAGSVTVDAGSTLGVAAGPAANAGSISIVASGAAAVNGGLLGRAGVGADGGAFEISAGSLDGFGALNRTLEQSGFTARRSFRVASGDLALGTGEAITAKQIDLAADGGSIVVDGALVAISDASRSSIAVSARNGIRIGAAGALIASAADPTLQRAGTIELATTAGSLEVAGTANVQAHGLGQSGSLTLRAPAAGNDFALASVPADLSRVDSVYLEPVRAYTIAAAPTGADFQAIRASLASYMATAPAVIRNRLGLSGAANVHVRPYADITRVGDLSLPALDFGAAGNAWHFGGQAAQVSIRATGNLNIAAVVGDGFIDASGLGLDLLNEASVSLNLVAGADLNSSSRRATIRNVGADLVLGNGAIVRTGTGSITLASARDIRFGAGSSVYTGGLKGAPTVINDDGVSAYADKGSGVRLVAGNDVLGSVMQQSVTDWQTRWSYVTPSGATGAYWGIDFGSFGWNLGALGGGDISVVAGRHVTDLSAAVADSAGEGAGGARVELGGGNLTAMAGGDIKSGYFYVARGQGDLKAAGAFSASGNRTSGNVDVGTLLVAGDASFALAATGDVLFEGLAQASVFSPTRQAEVDGLVDSYIYFLRYGADSALSVHSSGGDINFNPVTQSLVFADFGNGSRGAFGVYPGSLTINAFGGDVVLRDSFSMMPAPTGGVVVYAAQDISNPNRASIFMSDVGLQAATATNVSIDGSFTAVLNSSSRDLLHATDATLSSIVGGRDINDLSVKLAEAVQVRAGRDIRDLWLDTQQSGLATVTTVSAGRDLYYTSAANTTEIRVAGTGTVELSSGRDINLGFSKGITTVGNLLNGNLPAKSGAGIIAIAGLGQALGANGFVDAVVSGNTALQQQLIKYVEARTGSSGLDFAAAAALFKALAPTKQQPFLVESLFAELVASGREANADPEVGFERGYAALASLFPGSQGTVNPYSGDLSLPFSRIYTLGGGSVTLLAPGGKIDVGLANPPANLARLGLDRLPSQLGIVAQQAGDVHVMAEGDVLVNTSRIFTLGGGDIAIWSSKGNIDAGKGAKSAISAPPPTLTVDSAGNVTINLGSAVAGSGIRTIVTSSTVEPGDVDLIAPSGFVNAGDAGIGSAGNLNIAAQSVVGLDNIQVGGTSTGVPPETSGLAASLSGVTASASSSTASASNSIADSSNSPTDSAPLAEAALSYLEVFVIGLGEETCKQDDLECLKRQQPASR